MKILDARSAQASNNSEKLSLTTPTRRDFFKLGAIAGGGLALAFYLPAQAKPSLAVAADTAKNAVLNAYIQIKPSGEIIIAAQNPEIGQGVKTSLPMIIAEELDADWSQVSVVQSAIDAEQFGTQFAGGSLSIATTFDRLRHVGSSAKSMLIAAAASRWAVPSTECKAAQSFVTHSRSGRQLSYGELADLAAGMPVPTPEQSEASFKQRSDYVLLGKRIGGVDNRAIVTGEPLFGIDATVPGMQYAVYARCPATGGRVKTANLKEVKALPGVTDAFILQGNGVVEDLMPGVAIVAKSTWSALSARKKLHIEWDESAAAKDSWSAQQTLARELTGQLGASATTNLAGTAPTMATSTQPIYLQGEVDKQLDESAKRVDAFYQYPFVSHAQLEPQNCTAYVKDGRCELWAPTQMPQRAIPQVAKLLDIPVEAVTLNQTRIGGGFGRRLINDFCSEAAAISQKVGTPVKLQWTREDDMAHDFYRAGGFHSLSAGLDAQGKLTAWKNHFVSFSADGKTPGRGAQANKNEFPITKVAHAKLQQSLIKTDIPMGWWRAPMSCSVAFAMQGFIHELAVAANRDHREFLLELIEQKDVESTTAPFDSQRAAEVIRQVTKNAGWGGKLGARQGQGLAFYYSHAGYFAQVAEVSVDSNKRLRLNRVTVVGDVGPIINRSGAENQVEGSVIDGFSTAMGLQLDFKDGRIQESNYHQYPLLRSNSAPEIAIHFIESDNPPTGLGEPALPPVAPAVANAIFSATGERVREMPFTNAGFKV